MKIAAFSPQLLLASSPLRSLEKMALSEDGSSLTIGEHSDRSVYKRCKK
jgi:hypothetical protein